MKQQSTNKAIEEVQNVLVETIKIAAQNRDFVTSNLLSKAREQIAQAKDETTESHIAKASEFLNEIF